LALSAAILAGTLIFSSRQAPAVPGLTDTRPNIVMILTDDQRWDTLWAMDTVQAELVDKGMSFENFFAVNPLCCPSRATILTGRYSHTHGVYFNEMPDGGWPRFQPSEPNTVAAWLDGVGYHTGLVGKYVNRYQTPSHVPPGWDRWAAMVDPYVYVGQKFSVDGTLVPTGGAYSTDVVNRLAVNFIENAPPGQPLYLLMTPYGPHKPARPADRHDGMFQELSPHRPPNYNEPDVSDKPAYVRNRSPMSAVQRQKVDQLRIDMYESLQSVDEGVAGVLAALADTGRLSNSVIMFGSDNGSTWGEHRFPDDKNLPYEEVIRMPLVVRWDGNIPAGSTDDHLTANLDLAQTWADLAGAAAPGAEGASLVPLFDGIALGWRDHFLIEHGEYGPPAFCQVRSAGFSYVLYRTREEELYDLAQDPYQLTNQARNPSYQSVLQTHRGWTSQLCRPVPPLTH
jgi:arylsulfatase A-like enzyme